MLFTGLIIGFVLVCVYLGLLVVVKVRDGRRGKDIAYGG